MLAVRRCALKFIELFNFDEGILNAGNVLKTQEVEFVGIPFKW